MEAQTQKDLPQMMKKKKKPNKAQKKQHKILIARIYYVMKLLKNLFSKEKLESKFVYIVLKDVVHLKQWLLEHKYLIK